MADIYSDAGEALTADIIDGTTAAPTWRVGWGTGAGTTTKPDTALFTESAEARVVTVNTQPTPSVNRFVATMTSLGAQTITNAGIFALAAAGDMLLKSDFAGIALATGDKIEFTFELTWSQQLPDMADLVKTFSFAADSESFVFTSTSGDSTGVWLSSDGDPANGSLSSTIAGRKKSDTAHWDLTGITWESLGVPAGSTVTGVSVASCNHRCSVWVSGSTASLESISLVDGANTIELAGSASYTGTTAWTNVTGAGATGLSLASDNSISIAIATATLTSNTGTTDITLLQDELTFTVTYSAGSTTTPITLTPIAVGAVSSTRAVTLSKVVSITSVGTSSISKLISKALSIAATGTSVFYRAASYFRSYSYTATGTSSFSKGLVSSMTASVTAAGAVSFTSLAVVGVSLNPTAVGTSSISKFIRKSISYAGSGASTVIKGISKSFTMTATGVSLEQDAVAYTRVFLTSVTGAVSTTANFIAGGFVPAKAYIKRIATAIGIGL